MVNFSDNKLLSDLHLRVLSESVCVSLGKHCYRNSLTIIKSVDRKM